MGIDTVKLKSPPLGEKMVRSIERQCMRWQQLDRNAGEILYQIKGRTAGIMGLPN